jgi:hypothetical protein
MGLHLFLSRKFTTSGCGFGACNGLTLLVGKGNRRRKIRACELHDRASDVILLVWRQTAHGLKRFIEESCHRHNIRLKGPKSRLLFDGRPTSPIPSLGRISFRRPDIALAIEELHEVHPGVRI